MRRGKNCASVTTVAVNILTVLVGIFVMLLMIVVVVVVVVVAAVVSDVVALGHDTTERKNVHKAVACGDCGSRKECNRNR